jgi:hypothetical protein
MYFLMLPFVFSHLKKFFFEVSSDDGSGGGSENEYVNVMYVCTSYSALHFIIVSRDRHYNPNN